MHDGFCSSGCDDWFDATCGTGWEINGDPSNRYTESKMYADFKITFVVDFYWKAMLALHPISLFTSVWTFPQLLGLWDFPGLPPPVIMLRIPPSSRPSLSHTYSSMVYNSSSHSIRSALYRV